MNVLINERINKNLLSPVCWLCYTDTCVMVSTSCVESFQSQNVEIKIIFFDEKNSAAKLCLGKKTP